ncbi:MAG: glycosyltransferase family A protein [Pseudomonadota bacterium]
MPSPATAPPLVSCLCVTHDRVPMLRHAVACFLQQTWTASELVVLHEDRDRATAAYLATLAEPRIRPVAVPALPRLSLGAKRNRSVAEARGSHIAVWDDDDWHGPERLERQMAVLAGSSAVACTLRRLTVYDAATGTALLSYPRQWENTLVARKDALPPYADLDRGEDTACVKQLAQQNRIAWTDSPELYIYHCHGRNSFGRAHFRRRVFLGSQVLDTACAARAQGLLASLEATPLAAAELRLAQAAPPPFLRP